MCESTREGRVRPSRTSNHQVLSFINQQFGHVIQARPGKTTPPIIYSSINEMTLPPLPFSSLTIPISLEPHANELEQQSPIHGI